MIFLEAKLNGRRQSSVALVILFADFSVRFVNGYVSVLIFRLFLRKCYGLRLRVEKFQCFFALCEFYLPFSVVAQRDVIVFVEGFFFCSSSELSGGRVSDST